MRTTLIAAAACAVALFVFDAAAASTTAAGSRESLAAPSTLARWSVGADYEHTDRGIKRSGAADGTLQADTVAGFIGYDATEWLVLFVTAGGTTVDLADSAQEGGDHFKWSGGLGANLWHYDIRDPEFMSGRLSLSTLLEYAQYMSGDEDYEVRWNDFSVSLPIGYEIFTESIAGLREVPYSLMLSAGPILSLLDGDWEQSAGAYSSFHEDASLGVMGRADVFVSYNLSVGGQVQYFGDEYSASGFLRYHFR